MLHMLRPWLRRTPLLYRGFVRKDISTSTKITKPSQLPKLIITPGSVHHNSLPTFLKYAKRVNLASTRTVYVGTHYEYTVALSLLHLGFSLIRTGRRADRGIDLIGHWMLPPLPEPLRIIVQCKARSSGLSPKHVRELEGAFQGTPAEWRRKDVLGLLVTTHKATKGVLMALGANRWPMAFLKVSRTGVVEQFIWNRSASERGLEGVGITFRHTPKKLILAKDMQGEEDSVDATTTKSKLANTKDTTGTKKDVQLTWMGQPIFPDRSELDDETLKLGEEIASKGEELVPEEEPVVSIASVKSPKATKDALVDAKRSTRGASSAKQGRGRPKGPKTAMAISGEITASVRKGGRPKGSGKNVTKVMLEDSRGRGP